MTRSEAGKLGALKRQTQRIEEYNRNPNHCIVCGKKIELSDTMTPAKAWKKKTCSVSCQNQLMSQINIGNNNVVKKKREISFCVQCGVVLPKSSKKFCSTDCQAKYRLNQKIQDWKAGLDTGVTGTGTKGYIRNYMLEKAHYQCELCGWGEINPVTNSSPLTLHHKDGNYKNNNEDNLQILCPNCHSLTDTYCALNRHSSRTIRHKYTGRKKDVFQQKTKIDWPTDEELTTLVTKYSLNSLSKNLGVSTTAIKKRCLARNIIIPPIKKETL